LLFHPITDNSTFYTTSIDKQLETIKRQNHRKNNWNRFRYCNSCVSVMEANEPVVIANDEGALLQ
jgi:hypothetical protein